MASDKIIADYEEILQIIPQKPPVVMIDRLYFADKLKTVTGLEVKESNIFCRAGSLSEAGLIENIAQTAAAGVGYRYSKEGKTAPVGYIGAINKLVITELPHVNTLLKTEITVDYEVLGFNIIKGKVTSDDRIFAECEMKIFLKDDGSESSPLKVKNE